MFQFWWQQRRLKSLVQRAGHPLLCHYLQSIRPLLGLHPSRAQYLALDLELTGLDAQRDEIVALGIVPVNGDSILLRRARSHQIRPSAGVGESATCHQLRDIDLQDAASLEDVLRQLFEEIEGRLLLVHHANLDIPFLRHACRLCFGADSVLPVVDTQDIERHRQIRSNPESVPHALRLPECRREYRLPEHVGHDALGDALACAELFLAQQPHCFDRDTRVTDLIRLI